MWYLGRVSNRYDGCRWQDGHRDDSPRYERAVLLDGGDEGRDARRVGGLQEAVVRAGAEVRDGAVLNHYLLCDLLRDRGILYDCLLNHDCGSDVFFDDVLYGDLWLLLNILFVK